MSSQAAEPWTVLRLLNWTKAHFAGREVDEPRLAAEVLLADAMGCKRIELYARYDHVPSTAVLDAFRANVRKAAGHEPIAYLVGTKEFYSLAFEVTPAVLIPRPESEMLVEKAEEHLAGLDRPGRLWDACTGSGCVAIAAARQVESLQVLATDISAEAIDVAAGNAERLGVAQRVRCRIADALDLPDDAAELAPFDVITANPPYVRTDEAVAPSVRHEPEVALYGGADGFRVLGAIIDQAGRHLACQGALLLEFGIDQADEVRDRLLATGQFYEPEIYADLRGLDRIGKAVRK